ncbi:MAG: alanine--tRNA ligase [Candidatus Omnitrophota bacterium]
MKADILREKFLTFFKSKRNKIVESDSLVPKDDPTVLFTPAGMNQFKKQFLGHITDFTRAASSQRCLRTDDLDKVGKTDSHHTFFEMLGNFSFGDYFKEDAISWAWEFLTKELKIKEDDLWVSVYHDDDEAYKIWKDKVKVPEKKIVKLGDKENFWPAEAKQKGPNGPCGPCSEIFLDFGPDVGCRSADCSPACSCGRFVEVWNLVFTQFNRKEGGKLEPLPKKNIDTGMGLERLCRIMQGKCNNFETDLFQPIIKEIWAQAKKNPNNKDLYAIVDHLRAVVFAIYDGVMPSNEGRGYVVRKLIRKSILHLRGMGLKSVFLYTLVPVLSQVMKNPYPDLDKRREDIAEVILAEEKNFIKVLECSHDIIKSNEKEILDSIKKDLLTQPKNNDGTISISAPTCSAIAIKVVRLYDTYGIPVSMSIERFEKSVSTNGLKNDPDKVDSEIEEEFNKLKQLSKSRSKMQGDVFDSKESKIMLKETKFLGYKQDSVPAKILMVLDKEYSEIKQALPDEEVIIILDKTVFYGESGGQVGDTGEIVKGKNIFAVSNSVKSGKLISHIGKVKQGKLKKGDEVTAVVDNNFRMSVARNHTATHLLQAALRKVLGPHVQQQGSFVAQERMRFDFTHFKNIDKEELDRIERLVNDFILQNHPVTKKEMTLSQAKKQGALAFFGEKYVDKVRVVTVEGVSKELCAGTHLDNTGSIGLFKIISEGTVASGVRRIEARTGLGAYQEIKKQEEIVEALASILTAPMDKIISEVQKRISGARDMEKQLSSQKLNAASSGIDALISGALLINGKKVITKIIEDSSMDILRKTVDLIKQKTDNAIVALGSVKDGKAILVIGLTKDLADQGLSAGKFVQQVASVLGGSGGGRSDFAQAGGTKPENFVQAFEELTKIIEAL